MAGRESGGGFRPTGKLIGGGILGLVAVVLVIQNTETVRIDMLFWKVEWPLWIVLVIMFAIGGIVGYLAKWRNARR